MGKIIEFKKNKVKKRRILDTKNVSLRKNKRKLKFNTIKFNLPELTPYLNKYMNQFSEITDSLNSRFL